MLESSRMDTARELVIFSFTALFVTILLGCSGISRENRHVDIKVESVHAWEQGRAKNCMLLTGKPATEGGNETPDPKEMVCYDEPGEVHRNYIHISNVTLDNKAEKTFKDGHHWGVNLDCEQVSSSELKCLFNAKTAE